MNEPHRDSPNDPVSNESDRPDGRPHYAPYAPMQQYRPQQQPTQQMPQQQQIRQRYATGPHPQQQYMHPPQPYMQQPYMQQPYMQHPQMFQPQPVQQTVVVNNGGGKKVNHLLHLILSLLTAGLWLPVWIIIAMAKS